MENSRDLELHAQSGIYLFKEQYFAAASIKILLSERSLGTASCVVHSAMHSMLSVDHTFPSEGSTTSFG